MNDNSWNNPRICSHRFCGDCLFVKKIKICSICKAQLPNLNLPEARRTFMETPPLTVAQLLKQKEQAPQESSVLESDSTFFSEQTKFSALPDQPAAQYTLEKPVSQQKGPPFYKSDIFDYIYRPYTQTPPAILPTPIHSEVFLAQESLETIPRGADNGRCQCGLNAIFISILACKYFRQSLANKAQQPTNSLQQIILQRALEHLSRIPTLINTNTGWGPQRNLSFRVALNKTDPLKDKMHQAILLDIRQFASSTQRDQQGLDNEKFDGNYLNYNSFERIVKRLMNTFLPEDDHLISHDYEHVTETDLNQKREQYLLNSHFYISLKNPIKKRFHQKTNGLPRAILCTFTPIFDQERMIINHYVAIINWGNNEWYLYDCAVPGAPGFNVAGTQIFDENFKQPAKYLLMDQYIGASTGKQRITKLLEGKRILVPKPNIGITKVHHSEKCTIRQQMALTPLVIFYEKKEDIPLQIEPILLPKAPPPLKRPKRRSPWSYIEIPKDQTEGALSALPSDTTPTKEPGEHPLSQPETEAAKPGTEAAKPGTEAAKPGTEAAKPGTEAAKPGTEAAKPGTEAAKPVTEAAKPGTEAAKPVTEAAKPGTEAAKSGTEATKETPSKED